VSVQRLHQLSLIAVSANSPHLNPTAVTNTQHTVVTTATTTTTTIEVVAIIVIVIVVVAVAVVVVVETYPASTWHESVELFDASAIIRVPYPHYAFGFTTRH